MTRELPSPAARDARRSGRAAGAPRAARPKTHTESRPAEDTAAQPGFPWNVVVWDDPVNLMSYVVYVFQKLFGFSIEKATKHMLEVHDQGRSVVASADRERAEYYVTRLHAYGLQATLERASPA